MLFKKGGSAGHIEEVPCSLPTAVLLLLPKKAACVTSMRMQLACHIQVIGNAKRFLHNLKEQQQQINRPGSTLVCISARAGTGSVAGLRWGAHCPCEITCGVGDLKQAGPRECLTWQAG
jgi:hypothetical protein